MHVGRLTNPAKGLSTALACAIAIFALVAVWQPGGVRVAEAATVPVTAPGFAGAVSTAVPASTVLATIDNGLGTPGTTPLAAGGTITINFPAGTTVTGANIANTDFTIQQAAGCTGDTAGAVTAPGPAVPVAGATSVTLTVAAASLSVAGGALPDCAGQGLITISMSATAGGNEIVRPAAAGNVNVIVSLNNASTDLGSATVAIGGAIHHFDVTAVGGGAIPIQTSGVPFSIEITARDIGNGLIAGYAGTVDVTLTECPSGTMPATQATGFSGGKVTKSVTITATALTGCKIMVKDTVTTAATGTSSGFTVNPALTAPGTPTNLVVTPGDKTLGVTWTAPSGTVTKYQVNWSPGGTLTDVTGTSHTISGLTNGTSYTVTVRACNVTACSGEISGSGTPKAPAPAATAPGAPTNVEATAGPGEIEVTWDAPTSTGGATITSYIITCNPGGHTEVVDGSERSVVVTGLEPGTRYTCTVEAENSAGDGPGATSNSVTPTGGGAPPPGSQSVTVNGGAWVSGQNGVVLEGGGQASGMALIIQQVSGRVVLAIWVLTGGLYQFFLPATPGVSTLLSLPGLLVAAIAVLA